MRQNKRAKFAILLMILGVFSFQCDKLSEEAKKTLDREVNKKLNLLVIKQCNKLKVGSSTWQDCRRKVQANMPRFKTNSK